MASIGVLAAGIAHEINNPVGYINSNLEVLQENVKDITAYIKSLEDLFPNLSRSDREGQAQTTMQQVQRIRSEMRMDDVFQDIEEIVSESKQGLDRIKRIIIDLKKFSHTDENKMEKTKQKPNKNTNRKNRLLSTSRSFLTPTRIKWNSPNKNKKKKTP